MSTIGGNSWDLMCRGLVPGYCLHNPVSLLDKETGFPLPFDAAVELLRTHTLGIIRDIELQSMRKIAIFVIGMSHVRQRLNRQFDEMNPYTWKLDDGVNSRWRSSYLNEGYNGLIVLCVTPGFVIPPNSTKVGPQDYAVALEQRLIQIFSFGAVDPRLGNMSFSTGKMAYQPFAGAVYMAYKFF